MSDGTLSVRRRQPKASEAAAMEAPGQLSSGVYESFLGTDLSMIGELRVRSKIKSKPIGDANEVADNI